jgi:tRNA threonylcarbamoyladenosine biosynthesis protein TsaE
MEFITKNASETKNLGKKLADSLIDGGEKRKIIALSGELGSGKTTFTHGICKGLGIDDRIISPTFILVKKYNISNEQNKYKYLYHADIFRLEGEMKRELESLGLTEFWNNKNSIVLIEWAEKIKDFLPVETLWVKFEYLKGDSRKIIFN